MAVKVSRAKYSALISLKRDDLKKGEHLLFTVKVTGNKGTFSIKDEDGNLIADNNLSSTPQSEYRIKWPKSMADIPNRNDPVITLGISFIAAIKYEYVIERIGADGKLIEIINDVIFESNVPSDSHYSSLELTLI